MPVRLIMLQRTSFSCVQMQFLEATLCFLTQMSKCLKGHSTNCQGEKSGWEIHWFSFFVGLYVVKVIYFFLNTLLSARKNDKIVQ